jgi:hypothetical protein
LALGHGSAKFLKKIGSLFASKHDGPLRKPTPGHDLCVHRRICLCHTLEVQVDCSLQAFALCSFRLLVDDLAALRVPELQERILCQLSLNLPSQTTKRSNTSSQASQSGKGPNSVLSAKPYGQVRRDRTRNSARIFRTKEWTRICRTKDCSGILRTKNLSRILRTEKSSWSWVFWTEESSGILRTNGQIARIFRTRNASYFFFRTRNADYVVSKGNFYRRPLRPGRRFRTLLLPTSLLRRGRRPGTAGSSSHNALEDLALNGLLSHEQPPAGSRSPWESLLSSAEETKVVQYDQQEVLQVQS